MTGYLFRTSTCSGSRAIKSSGAGLAKGSGFSVAVGGLGEGFAVRREEVEAEGEEEGEVGRAGFWDRAGQ